MKKLTQFIPFVFAVIALGILLGNRYLSENAKTSYREDSSWPSPIRFKEAEVGLDFHHILNVPYPDGVETYKSVALLFTGIPAGMTTIDLNGDEYIDLCLSNPVYKRPLLCYENRNGQFFDVTDEIRLGVDFEYVPSALYSADFNNDGLSDLLVVAYGEHIVFLQDHRHQFYMVKNLWFSNAWGANIYDFNGDGNLDIVFANYFSNVDLNKNRIPWYYKGIASYGLGDINSIWMGNGDGSFSNSWTYQDKAYRQHTTAIGIADYNRDGITDIFEANDYSIDRLYELTGPRMARPVLNRIPLSQHGRAGMNAEFFDVDGDGFLDIFVSNIMLPPLTGRGNVVWIWDDKGQTFVNKARQLKVERCGYAWTGKFIDFDLDGFDELVVASGLYSSKNGKFNANYTRMIRSNTPDWFPARDPQESISEFSVAMNPRPCLFTRNSKKSEFHDISPRVIPWQSKKASRLLLVTDVNNDGLVDVLIPEHDGKLKVYLNKTETTNHWAGLIFKNKVGNIFHFGIKAELVNQEGEVVQYFEMNPANGFKAEQDPRKVIGLGNYVGKLKLRVFNGREVKEYDVEKDRYNKISID